MKSRQESSCCFFLTHASFLKSKPTEAKSGYYLSGVPSLCPLSLILPLEVYEILLFEEKQRATSVLDEGKWVYS